MRMYCVALTLPWQGPARYVISAICAFCSIIASSGCAGALQGNRPRLGAHVHDISLNFGPADVVVGSDNGFPHFYRGKDHVAIAPYTMYYVTKNWEIDFNDGVAISVDTIDQDIKSVVLEPFLKDGRVADMAYALWSQRRDERRSSY
jgi:hypothetical protein